MERKYESANSYYDGPWAGRETIHTDSVFLQDQAGVWDRLFLTLGGRYDNHQISALISTTALTWQPFCRGRRQNCSAARPGFRAPSIYELTSAFYGNPNLKPEVNTGWEGGFEQPVLDKRIKFGATYFNNVLTDLIEFSPQTFKYSQEGERVLCTASRRLSARPSSRIWT